MLLHFMEESESMRLYGGEQKIRAFGWANEQTEEQTKEGRKEGRKDGRKKERKEGWKKKKNEGR